GLRLEVLREELRALEELVQELGSRELRRAAGVVREVLHQPLRRRHGLVAERAVRGGDLLEHVAEWLLAAAARLGGPRELDRREPVERGHREAVDVAGVRGQRDGGEERDEQPDLRPLVELAPTREVRG